ncbi:acyl-CoA-binding domain-containing protein 6 isoform X1 [Sus scrofa]|uniref:acyl-CoA-binding domain-containing protein 6 isoform X1 n=1 Tax=Sus scrofa TaxID=9823 RepID=UPI0006B191C2|nr:acyl-CoA-binding domain-containing protein 6 isoform X1 [Sus scrofa]
MASPFLPSGATTGDSGGELSSGDDSGDAESLQSPETEASRSLTELFEKAAAHLQGLVQVASREQLLYLYARYKQVKVGNCNTPKPSFFDFEGKQKWEAWKALGDSSPSQAMQEYIAVVKKLDPDWNPQLPEKKGKETNTGFGGPVVSSLYHEEIIREEDKNIFDYCRENNIDHITKVIKSKNVDVNMKDEEGRALLHWACDRGHKDLVTVLLQYRADINSQRGTIYYLVLQHFITSEGRFVPIKQSLPISPFPQTLATTDLLSVSVDLPILDILYKWGHKICGLCVWLLSLGIFSRSIHFVACKSTSFLVMANFPCIDHLFISS